MAEPSRTHANWIGRDLYDSAGEKIGSITDIYYDDRTGRPEWMTVSTGWFGSKTQFVPIAGTTTHGDDIRVEFDTELIKGAPAVDVDDAHLDEQEEQRLYRHYGFDSDATDPDLMYGQRDRADEGYEYYDWREAEQGRTSATDDTVSTTRSEEELSVDKTARPAGQARLRKYVVTEDVNVTVPVKKQVARLVREPASGEVAGRIEDRGDAEEEVTLMEEEVTVDKRTVAKERVGLEVDEVTDTETVSDTVRKEQVEVEGDIDRGGTTR